MRRATVKPRRQHWAIDMNFIEGMGYHPPASLYMLMIDSCGGERIVPIGTSELSQPQSPNKRNRASVRFSGGGFSNLQHSD